MSESGATLIGRMLDNAERRPDALYARYLFSDREPAEVSYAAHLERTRSFAAGYAAHGVARGSVVLVILEHHEDLMPAFLGATWLGGLPAFLPYPGRKTHAERFYASLEAMIEKSKPRCVVSRGPVCSVLERVVPPGPDRPDVLGVEDLTSCGLADAPTLHGPEDPALIQYSSGSTGLQKGAVLSHRAILGEIAGVGGFFDIDAADSFLTWVPLYHDWGLVCVALHALAIGTSYTLMSPVDWVGRPVGGLEAAHRYRPTIFYQPNFAFNLMTQRVKDREMEGLDLSSIRLMCNGAEPCFYESHAAFAERFRRWGFRPDALGIVYGMAEVTNSVIAAGHREPIKVDTIDRFVMQSELRAVPCDGDGPAAQRMLGVGRGLEGTEFKIVDDLRRELPDRQVGEVAIRSCAAFHGYHNNPEATAAVVDADGWYYSGDMGYRADGTLYITGRKSDMIIVGGVNIYPQDIEAIVGEHPMAVAGRIAAIGVDDPELGTQKIVLLVESRSEDPAVHAEISTFARTAVSERLDVVVSRVVHVPRGWLIKTSSGKIARIPNYRRLGELGA